MTDLEIIVAARALIADPAHWTQGAAARNRHGNAVLAHDESAVCWCASGALFKAAGKFNYTEYHHALWSLEWALDGDIGRSPLVPINDRSTHAQMLEIFDRKIAQMRAS